MNDKNNIRLAIIVVFVASIIYTVVMNISNLKSVYQDKSLFSFLLFEIALVFLMTNEYLTNKKKENKFLKTGGVIRFK